MRARVALALVLLASPARAQLSRETSPVDQPGYGLAAPDGPESVVLNPAAMAFLASWGVSYLHADGGDTEAILRGDGFYAATPILFGIAAGIAVDSVRPTPAIDQGERTMVSLALGWQWEDMVGIGA